MNSVVSFDERLNQLSVDQAELIMVLEGMPVNDISYQITDELNLISMEIDVIGSMMEPLYYCCSN